MSLRQSTLTVNEQREDSDDEYGHLVTHLMKQDGSLVETSQWTNVFSRDMPAGMSVQVQPIGPDLIFDRSLRNTMSGVTELAGEVTFSPFMFKATDLAHDVESAMLSMESLLELGKTATQAKIRFTEANQLFKD